MFTTPCNFGRFVAHTKRTAAGIIALLLALIVGGYQFSPMAQTFQQLYAFHAGLGGYGPEGGLVQGSDGNFYGTTAYGGQPTTNCSTCGYGTVFRITPDGAFTTTARFDGISNGEYPFGSLLQATDGNFYGTTADTTVFQMTPSGVPTTLGATSGQLVGDLVQANNGYLYGADSYYDIIFSTPLTGRGGSHVAAPGTPSGGLIQEGDGNLYGLTSNGGTYGFGTAYKLTPSGVLTTLVSFGGNNSRWPYGKMLQASDGNLYGVCDSPEQVFRLTLSGRLTTFAVFGTNGDWGYSPNGGLIEANDGNFYGTTQDGGPIAGAQGTVFKMTPQGHISTLIVFSYRGAYPGSGPLAGLVQGTDGNLYGTCAYGGDYGWGNIFRIIMPGPALTINSQPSTPNQLVLSWRTNYTGFTLQCSGDLNSTNWTDCTNEVVLSGNQFFVTNSVSIGARFFRLKK